MVTRSKSLTVSKWSRSYWRTSKTWTKLKEKETKKMTMSLTSECSQLTCWKEQFQLRVKITKITRLTPLARKPINQSQLWLMCKVWLSKSWEENRMRSRVLYRSMGSISSLWIFSCTSWEITKLQISVLKFWTSWRRSQKNIGYKTTLF